MPFEILKKKRKKIVKQWLNKNEQRKLRLVKKQ